jgi:metallo-beta-lactamase class B
MTRHAVAMMVAVLAALCPGLGLLRAQATDLLDAYKQTQAAQALVPRDGEDLTHITMLCWPASEQIAMLYAMPDPPPTKVFDNMYFVGRGRVSAWAITTSAGIILIDTLDNPKEADDFIITGFKKLGLDPATVKYILVTHGHGDHYGGAVELQHKIPGARVLMSAVDYDLAQKAAAFPGGPFQGVPAPKRDLVVSDGQKLTLGDETLTLYITPGHTPGTISALIPVRDHGKPYVMGLFGGNTFPADRPAAAQFGASLTRFRKIMSDAHVAGRMSNHALWDNSLEKLAKINADPKGPNPYFESASDMQRYSAIQDRCMRATLDRMP